MNMNNAEALVSALNNSELKTLVIALKRYNDIRPNGDGVLMSKLVDAFLLSNELEATVVGPAKRKSPMGTAEGKAYLASM